MLAWIIRNNCKKWTDTGIKFIYTQHMKTTAKTSVTAYSQKHLTMKQPAYPKKNVNGGIPG